MSERRGRRSHLVVYGLVGLTAVFGLIFAASRRDRTIPLGAPARFDDFAFAVVDVRRLASIEGLKPVRGSFLVVRLGIRNQAKRVDFRFDAARTLVEGGDGRRFGLDGPATRRMETAPAGLPACDRPIQAGQSCTTDLVFDVPVDIRSPRLRLASDPVGDILDGLFEGGRAGFALGRSGDAGSADD